MIVHPIPPVFDRSSRVLVLGSFPSVKSREANFFYGHPQNRFWKVAAAVFGEAPPVTVEEKKAFLLRNHIAVWDVIHSCDITGSSDASIRNVVPNDLSVILSAADIRAVFVNGNSVISTVSPLNSSTKYVVISPRKILDFTVAVTPGVPCSWMINSSGRTDTFTSRVPSTPSKLSYSMVY